jgi:hypothetical protein
MLHEVIGFLSITGGKRLKTSQLQKAADKLARGGIVFGHDDPAGWDDLHNEFPNGTCCGRRRQPDRTRWREYPDPD